MSVYRCGDGTCGATDCESCCPGSNDWVECRRCGRHVRRFDADEWDCEPSELYGVCDECLAKDEDEANGDGDGGLKGADQ